LGTREPEESDDMVIVKDTGRVDGGKEKEVKKEKGKERRNREE